MCPVLEKHDPDHKKHGPVPIKHGPVPKKYETPIGKGSFNLSFPECKGSWENHFQDIPGTCNISWSNFYSTSFVISAYQYVWIYVNVLFK